MNEGKASDVLEPVANAEILKFGAIENARSILDQNVRDGARKMLQAALEDEVNAFLELNSTKVDCDGRRLVVRNGHMPSRELVTGEAVCLYLGRWNSRQCSLGRPRKSAAMHPRFDGGHCRG